MRLSCPRKSKIAKTDLARSLYIVGVSAEGSLSQLILHYDLNERGYEHEKVRIGPNDFL